MGDTQVTRAQFNSLYNLTRQNAMTRQYISAGWRRTSLYPFNANRVLQRPEVALYRPISPQVRPPSTHVGRTPNGTHETRQLAEQLMAKTTRSGKVLVRQIMSAFDKEASVNKVLSTEIKGHRKRALDNEELATAKRLKKQDELRSWGAREVLLAKGYTPEEADVVMDAMPRTDVIYSMIDELDY